MFLSFFIFILKSTYQSSQSAKGKKHTHEPYLNNFTITPGIIPIRNGTLRRTSAIFMNHHKKPLSSILDVPEFIVLQQWGEIWDPKGKSIHAGLPGLSTIHPSVDSYGQVDSSTQGSVMVISPPSSIKSSQFQNGSNLLFFSSKKQFLTSETGIFPFQRHPVDFFVVASFPVYSFLLV